MLMDKIEGYPVGNQGLIQDTYHPGNDCGKRTCFIQTKLFMSCRLRNQHRSETIVRFLPTILNVYLCNPFNNLSKYSTKNLQCCEGTF